MSSSRSLPFPSAGRPSARLRIHEGCAYEFACDECGAPLRVVLDETVREVKASCAACACVHVVNVRARETSPGAWEVEVVGVSKVIG